VNAKRSEDGRTMTLQVVNPGAETIAAEIRVTGFAPRKPQAEVTELAGALEAVNTASSVSAIVPKRSAWNHRMKEGRTSRTFPPHSFSVVRFE
jgi:alpha-L-arabinofuranosidase